ncbi:hypothetical protein DRI50_09170 [candidate division KSB1 bacterium]|nr:MAG: hypothetical protein DRI50_09170 [candidate division KSB1 bacterium]
MRISSKSWPVKNAEQSYQKISPSIKKIRKTSAVKETEKTLGLRKISKKKNENFKPADILSLEEKDALKMLFQDDNYFSFYGHTKVHQVQPGMLLDLKG